MSWQAYWDNLNPHEPPYSDPEQDWLDEHREICNGCSKCEQECFDDE